MALQWIRLDTSVFDHPKMLELLDARAHRAINLHLFGMTYTGKHGLDGFVPRTTLRIIGATPADAKRLVDAGLWHPEPTGWSINGWDEYQISNDETKARKSKARAAAIARWHGPEGDVSNAQ